MSIDFSKITGLSDRYGKVVQISDKYGGVLWRKPEHVHSFLSDWVIDTAATCITAGQKHRVCSTCGHIEKETIPATGIHTYTDVIVPPTCEGYGYTTHTCSVCGNNYTDSQTEPNGHTWGDPYYDNSFSTGYGYVCTVCGKPQSLTPPAHVHSYTYSETVAATCETGGYEVWVCTCGASEHRNETEALGHSYTSTVKAPTCEEGGYTTHTCTRCGHSYTDSATEPNGHFWGVDGGWVTDVAATCEKGGTEKHTCVNCGKVETRNTDPLGHDWSENTVEYGNGFAYECERCGAYDPIEPENCDHTPEVVDVIAPTCTTGGYTQYKCSLCGWEWNDDETEALEHKPGDPECVRDATCTKPAEYAVYCTRDGCGVELDRYEDDGVFAPHIEDGGRITLHATCATTGIRTYYCKECDTWLRDEEIPTTDHNYDSEVIDPTCEEYGYTLHTCRTCGDTYTDESTEPTGHNWGIGGGWHEVIAATCTDAGEEERECLNCTEHESREIPATGHSYKNVVTEPTCENGGYTTHTCSKCNDSYTDGYTNKLPHSWTDWYVTKHPTCDEDGTNERTCSACGETETEPIEALNHKNTTYHAGKAATCTEDGYTGYNECSDCGKIIDGKYPIPAKGHTEVVVTGSAATCTTAGKTDGKKCSVCGTVTVEQKPIPALGHSYTSKVTPATCTEGGYTTHTCTVCGHSYTDSQTEPNGHNFASGWQTVTAATCTKQGSEKRTCLTCGHTETRVVKALGHDWGTPFYDDGSSSGQSHTCERCGETEEY